MLQALKTSLGLSPQENDIMDAYLTDLYATTLNKMSLAGMVSDGFDGDHELIKGGYCQVSPYPPD